MGTATTARLAAFAGLAAVGAIGAAAFVGFAGGPTAGSDARSDYVSYLDSKGVAYGDARGVIALGKENVCHALRLGEVPDAVIGSVVRHGYSPHETAYIVVGAINFMCPDQIPTLESWNARQHPGVDRFAGTTTI